MNATLENSLIERTLHFVAERSWRKNDSDFHTDLVKFLGEHLGVAFAFCVAVKPDDPTQVDTLALWAHGEVTANISYSLENTPCENVIGRTTCCYVENVQKLFPEDELLVDMKAESYAGTPIWSAEGEPLGLVAVVDDKPLASPELVKSVLQIVAVRAGGELERMHFLHDLARREQRFRDFSAASSDWLWETDDQLRWIYLSEQFEPVTGVPSEQLLGKTRAEVGAPGSTPEALQELLDTMDRREPFTNFVHHRDHPTKGRVYVAISAVPAFENGKFIGYRGTGRDITKRVQTEERMREAISSEQKANNAKSEFLASMSHELRTPLNAIIGFTEALMLDNQQTLDRVQKEYLSYILGGGKHLLGLINDVLDLSRIEADVIELKIEAVNTFDVIEDCLHLTEPLDEGGSMKITNTVPKGLASVVRADETRLRQVILNLLSNAIRYTKSDGQIHISGEPVTGGFFRITITDNGRGIRESEQKNLFQLFHRAHPNSGLTSEGTGVGLYVSKHLIEKMHGQIGFTSTEDVGSTFWIDLPLS